MGNDILTSIVAVEKEIRGRLAAEKKRGEERLVLVRAEAEAEIRREEEALSASLERAVAKARVDAERESAEILEEAGARAARLAGVSEELLERVVLKYLLKILPGRPS